MVITIPHLRYELTASAQAVAQISSFRISGVIPRHRYCLKTIQKSPKQSRLEPLILSEHDLCLCVGKFELSCRWIDYGEIWFLPFSLWGPD